MNSINNTCRMIPVDVEGSALFGDAHEYHLQKAKANIGNTDHSVSADEIRQVAAFIKLKTLLGE